MKGFLISVAARIANTRVVRSSVAHLVYPTITRCLGSEIQPDVESPSGIAEALAWKNHSYMVLNEELASTGTNCCTGRMRSDRETRFQLIDLVLARLSSVPGDVFEFGVAGGESFLYFLERCPNRRIYGFDSFEGLPEDWWTRPKGTFRSAPPQFDNPNALLVNGLFEKSIPEFASNWHGHAALLHVDCDLYSSTITCLRYLLPSCTVGSIVLFDEYYNYPGFSQHEWLAWRQARIGFGITASCLGYDGRRAAFQIDCIRPPEFMSDGSIRT